MSGTCLLPRSPCFVAEGPLMRVVQGCHKTLYHRGLHGFERMLNNNGYVPH